MREEQIGRPLVLVEPAELQELLAGERKPAVLDVRWKLGDPDGRLHFESGHIPAAVYVDLDTELASPASAAGGRHPLPDLGELERAARRWGIKDGQTVVVYDDNGGMAAARGWWLLSWAGIADVRILNGALGAWLKAGLPVEQGAASAAVGDVSLRSGGRAVLSADEAAQLAGRGVLLDARAPERYLGEQEPIDPKAGHIPGALNAPTTGNLDADGRFLTAEQLRTRFAELGVDGSRPVGAYCGSGVTAAHLIAALQVAGIEAALFPGSWSAWSADRSRPVAVGEAAGAAEAPVS